MQVPHVALNISSDSEAKRLFLEKGYDLLPVFEIGGNTITDYTGEPDLIEVLTAEGYL